MIDFLMISTRSSKRGVIEIYPKFIIKKSSDLMIRGGDFYAIWVEERGLWSTDEQDALRLIDRELDEYAKENASRFDSQVRVLHMWDADSGMIDRWHKYCQKQMRDNFHMLDEKLIFSNSGTNKEDYASKRLPYPLEPGDYSAYDKLISTLYSEKERHKIEWAIGSIVNGDSKHIQKFIVLYGAMGTGKSTILNIMQQLFEGYYSVFDAKSLGSSNSSFALEAFRSNPLLAIQHDGDLSKIEDNTRLNSLVSHELMVVNEKFRSAYSNSFKCFLILGTNKPVRITDAKSGLIRRLIDVSPSGERLPIKEYKSLMKKIDFELGAIASHCLEVYESNPGMYDDYIPLTMLGATNDFYNFMLDSYSIFKKDDCTTLKAAWEMYRTYCDEAKVAYPYSQRIFKEELKNYFKEYADRATLSDGTRVRSYYSIFRTEKFESQEPIKEDISETKQIPSWLEFNSEESIFDECCASCPAQYTTEKGTPIQKWDRVKTTLSELDTSKLHYVKVPENHIVIDFDIPDESGDKSYDLNLEEASKWPKTYAELSKSGNGIHLHYLYSGDVSKLSRIYEPHIEIKVFNGNGSLRRKLTKCNDIPISVISSGLPMKGEKVVSKTNIKTEKGLRTFVIRNLNKEIWPNTRPSVNFIHDKLEEVYQSGMKYDISDMKKDLISFAAASTHQSDACLRLVQDMKLKSADQEKPVEAEKKDIVFYDVEVFPNLFLVNWKFKGPDKPVMRMINPTPAQIETLLSYNLIGFNCRRYDNHILYARLMGYTNEQLYHQSQDIISGKPNAMFVSAYNLSYTDVYDFSSKKQSLKKFEIELGIHHQELGLPWDQPVPEELWEKVAEYCDNDVLATEAVFNARKGDFVAREILADVAGMTVNETTNKLTTRIIFGDNRHPQDQFNYRDMGDDSVPHHKWTITSDMKFYPDFNDDYTLFDDKGRPIFKGYKYEAGKSTYRGETVGEGGYVYSETGMYENVEDQDVSSMHPHSAIAEELWGPIYTPRFAELLYARIAIKHKEFDKAKTMLNGSLAKYLTDEDTAKGLDKALKIAINSVYGLTAAKFDNPFHDIRNKDNIVAKRGALFMINLKHIVQDRGFTVAHIKTDSIKIPNATPELVDFIKEYGKLYGYTFEREAFYEKMCLVNKAVYIAKTSDGEWVATGEQFAVPYVFKTLFSHEPIEFKDLCETKQVQSAIYLDMNEGLPDVSDYEKQLAKYEKAYKKGDVTKEEFDDICAELKPRIDEGHHYVFVGRVGQFCPIKPGCGGGRLVREQNGKFYAVEGTTGYRWLESEVVKNADKQDDIDMEYFNKLANDAIDTISQYGDFEWFVS